MEVKDNPDVQLKELIDTIHRDGVDKVRREEHRELKAVDDETLTGTKYLWLRNPAKMSAPALAMLDELRDSGFFARFRRVIFYGASMGGYAAAAFSSAAPGATVILISP